MILVKIYGPQHIDVLNRVDVRANDNETLVFRSTISFYRDALSDFKWIVDTSDAGNNAYSLSLDNLSLHELNLLNFLRNQLIIYHLKEAKEMLQIPLSEVECEMIGLKVGRTALKKKIYNFEIGAGGEKDGY